MKAKSGKTILIVEDADAVRTSLGAVLRLQGYNVLLAADAQQALEIASKSKDPIDLLITDVVLPKINGLELAEKMQQQQSVIKVLFMSGYSEEAVFQKFGSSARRSDFIQKPSSMDELLEKITSLLNEDIESGQ